MKRVFLIVLDSVGIGALPDAATYGDEGSHTLAAAATSSSFSMPTMQKLGLFNIDEINCGTPVTSPAASFAKLSEASKGKDTTIGHWEITGIISEQPLPTFPKGFPKELLDEFSKQTGRGVLCNKPYSGTAVIQDYGEEHMRTGDLIVYTSADSVFQIAAHETIVPIEELYRYCEIARSLCTGKFGVGRIIARPFEGAAPDFKRTTNRHDYSLLPPSATLLDQLWEHEKDVIAVGKITDIFGGQGIGTTLTTKGNEEGIERTIECTKMDFNGLCFVNLVDFDMLYGHRNDVDGYAKALSYFDYRLPEIITNLKPDDILMITADHGCDPATKSTDHSREYTPLIIYGPKLKSGINLGTRDTFADIAATILDYFNIPVKTKGTSVLHEIL